MKDKLGYERGACNNCDECQEFVPKEDSVRCERCNCKPVYHDLAGSCGSLRWESPQPRSFHSSGLQPPVEEGCKLGVGSKCALSDCNSRVGFDPNTGEEFSYCSLHRDAGIQPAELSWSIQNLEIERVQDETVISATPCATPGLPKCAIPECAKPCHVDENGVKHKCCGYTHAMEYQRRLAIEHSGSVDVVKGITHCLLPECNLITWPFENYCGRSHADIGKARRLMPPVVPVSLSETGGARADPRNCIIPGCNKQKFLEGDIVHHYCGKTHAELGKQYGILPTAKDDSDQCDMEGCTRPKYKDGPTVYDYCCRQHAQEDAPNRVKLTEKGKVEEWLAKFSNLKVVSLEENPEAKPGGRLFERYRKKALSLPKNLRQTCLAFHGTKDSNIPSILKNGYDPKLRRGQTYGPGEYFAATPSISMGYSSGRKMIVNELLLGNNGIHHTKSGDINVMKDPDHDLPRFVLTFR